MQNKISQTSKIFLFLIFGIFFLNLASATMSCKINNVVITNIDRTVNQSQTPSNQLIQCTNNGISSVTINKQGSFFLTSPVFPETTNSNDTTGITIIFNQMNNVGLFEGMIYFSDGSTPINININVVGVQEQPTTGCRLIELPHTTTFRLKQGETGASGEIKVKASTECGELDFNVVEQTQMTKPMFIQSKGESLPGKEYSFTIGLDAVGVETGSYSNYYIVSASSGNEVYQKSIPLSLVVTQGISAIENNTFSNYPTCSVASEMKVNSTDKYKLVCQNENPNIKIEIPYNEYVTITSLSENAGTSEYLLKPKKVGTALFFVLFKYNDIVVGDPFIKEIRISYSGTSTSGNQIDVSFYQDNLKKALSELLPGLTSILVKDINTQGIVSSFTAYLNGQVINNSFNLEANKPYELIIDSHDGYISKTINFTLNPKYIEISLTPSSGWVENNPIYYNTTPSNVSLFLDSVKLNNNYFMPSAGVHTLEAILDGWQNTKINITVLDSVRLISPIIEWKKGTQQVMLLSKNVSWQINYAKDSASQYNPISNGIGDKITFTPDKSGLYQVIADGKTVDTKEIKGWNLNKKWWFMAWYWWIIIGIILIIFAIWLYNRNSGGGINPSQGGFQMQGVGGSE